MADVRELEDWQDFIVDHGWRAHASELAHVVGRTVEEVIAVRDMGVCARLPSALRFAELFSLWHGRAANDSDWPLPQKSFAGSYRWLPNEDALLASLVGQLAIADLTVALSARLRVLTGDQEAERSQAAVQVRINRLGLCASDVLGGITVAVAGRAFGSKTIIQQAIRTGSLHVRRQGRLWVIPHEEWARWKALRNEPPKGKVKLASIKQALGIRSDKLPEFARMGYVPTAEFVRLDLAHSYGEWYVDSEVAAQLVNDRRNGRPMPWHGQPNESNLKKTFACWSARAHPVSCSSCVQIWGSEGAPADFEAFRQRYPPLAHGAKRHLTMKWTPGLSLSEVAALAAKSESHVRAAIEAGVLTAHMHDGCQMVTRTLATRWIARKCPDGQGAKSWLTLEFAERLYKFSQAELASLIDAGKLKHKVGTNGPMRGVTYVLKQQCAELRHQVGFSAEECAERVGVTVERFLELLDGVHWRKGGQVPLDTLNAVIKRLESDEGYTMIEAAIVLGMPVSWVNDRVGDGTVRVKTNRWNPARVYLTQPMLNRLVAAKTMPRSEPVLGPDWLTVGKAAQLAGVAQATLEKWCREGDLNQKMSSRGCRYQVEEIKVRARRYWATVRFRRAEPPAWLRDERQTFQSGEAQCL